MPSPAVVPTRVPDPPAAPAAAPGNARLTVSFVAPFDGGSAIVGYGAACVSSNGGLPGAKAGVSSPIVVTALSNGKSYTCTVTATNANGTSVPSPASAAVVPSTVPTAPAQPKVAVGNAQLTVSFAAPSSGGSPITSYTTTCSSTNGGKPASKAGPRSPLTVTGVTNGRTYKCAVIARNANGAGRGSVASVPVVPFDPATVRARSVHGFRLFAGDGGVFTFGDAANYGSAAGLARDPVVGMASTFDDRGYWLVASDGGIFSFGDARFFGSTGAMRLTQPIVGMTATPTGKGYWLVASDGGIFTFGDARFHGSAAPVARSPIAGMATTATGAGYWIAASDGSVYAFGDAPALGGAPASALRLPVRGIASTSSGRGYWLAAGDGGLFAFGDAPYLPWPAPLVLSDPIRGVSR
ncbi:MAG TPA: fibronectin type III domain-containing protein [Acidimicrobiia bacterium]|nr:fibronectin type III domain-containing protein [Acidimicrobiia bacterium]